MIPINKTLCLLYKILFLQFKLLISLIFENKLAKFLFYLSTKNVKKERNKQSAESRIHYDSIQIFAH